MRVLVAGASGVIGRQLIPLLVSAGHDVIELTRPGAGVDRPGVVEADALDRTSVTTAIRRVAPDAVVDMLTAIPPAINPRHLARDMALTNRLRTEGTANLIAAAGSARLVSQGVAYAYRPTGGPLADEDQPLWSDGPKQFRPVVQALVEHERMTANVGGVVLRLGHLYGHGSIYAADGSFVEQLRSGRVPLVGRGDSVFSFTHAHDAATAIVAALTKPVAGALNIVDDDPAPVRDWLPEMARLLGAPAPKRVPKALARLAVGSWGVAFMAELTGADNRRARRQLDWRPGHPSWRSGFAAELER